MVNRRIMIVIGLAAVLAPASSRADRERDRDHDRARRAVEQGEALPLAAILARIGPELGGEIVRVSFKRKHERWVYEFKVVDAAGRLIEISVDAASAAVLKREEH